jgi:protein phosphatase
LAYPVPSSAALVAAPTDHRSFLVDTELTADGTVNYAAFLDRYRVTASDSAVWQEEVAEQICRKLFHTCANLEEAYKLFDINTDGLIEYHEFVSTLAALDLGLTEDQVFELMRSMDLDCNATVDFKEFISVRTC